MSAWGSRTFSRQLCLSFHRSRDFEHADRSTQNYSSPFVRERGALNSTKASYFYSRSCFQCGPLLFYRLGHTHTLTMSWPKMEGHREDTTRPNGSSSSAI